jgi:hypothetical protein
MNTYDVIIKNGVYIICVCGIYSVYNPILSLYIYLKAFSANYYYHYSFLYPIPRLYKWKHLIRLTDTGHIANFLFYFYPPALPICYNVQFIICFAYHITINFFAMKDKDDAETKTLINELQVFHCEINHSVPYLILCYFNTQQKYDFNSYTLWYSYVWVYSWLLFVYTPWRYYTSDSVYSVLDNSVSLKTKGCIVGIVHILIYVANQSGYYMNEISLNNNI